MDERGERGKKGGDEGEDGDGGRGRRGGRRREEKNLEGGLALDVDEDGSSLVLALGVILDGEGEETRKAREETLGEGLEGVAVAMGGGSGLNRELSVLEGLRRRGERGRI